MDALKWSASKLDNLKAVNKRMAVYKSRGTLSLLEASLDGDANASCFKSGTLRVIYPAQSGLLDDYDESCRMRMHLKEYRCCSWGTVYLRFETVRSFTV